MQVENRIALMRILSYLDSTFHTETGEQLISQVKTVAHFDTDSEYVGDSDLIRVIRLLLEEEVFLPLEGAELDEDDMIHVMRSRSLGVLNELLRETILRVVPFDTSTEIVKIIGVM